MSLKQFLKKNLFLVFILGCVFLPYFAVQAGEETKTIELDFRDNTGYLLKNIVSYAFYTTKYDANQSAYPGNTIASGKIGDSGSAIFKVNVNNVKPPYILKVWSLNANAGEYYFYDIRPTIGTTYKLDVKIPTITFTLKDADNNAKTNFSFNLYTQKTDVNGRPYKDKLVGRLTTGNYGQVKAYLGPNTYLLEIPVATGNYYRYDIVLGKDDNKILNYRLSNLAVTVRDGFSNLLPNAKFDIIQQKYNVDGSPYLDKKIGSYSTDKYGRKEVLLPSGTYAVKFYGSNNLAYTFWTNEIDEGIFKELSYKLSTFRFLVKDVLGNLLTNQKLEVWEQQTDASGQKIVGKKLFSTTTGAKGTVDAYIPPGTYLLKVLGTGGQDYLYWDQTITDNAGKSVRPVLSSLRVITILNKTTVAKNVRFSVSTQKTDLKGNLLIDKKIIDQTTNTKGYADVYVPAGKYAITFGNNATRFNMEVKDKQVLVVTYKLADQKTNLVNYIGEYYRNQPGSTPPSEEPAAKPADSDNDGLTDADELKYLTDVKKADTDGDGYNDGEEVLWGFDPTKVGEYFIRPIYAFQRPRLLDLAVETERGDELKAYLKKNLAPLVFASLKNWQDLTVAYVYGGYSLEEIAKEAKYPGKIIDPLKLLREPQWRLTALYREYIAK